MNKATSSSVHRKLHSILTDSTAQLAPKKTGSFTKLVNRFIKNSNRKSFRLNMQHYTDTVQTLAKHKRLPMIKQILEHQKNFNDITNELFTSRIIYLYGQAGMFREARKLFDEMPKLNCARTVYSFNALLSACIDSGRGYLLKGIVKQLPLKLEITLDAVSYNTIIKGFCKIGSLNDALKCFELMLEKGVRPNVITFNTLLWGFYSRGMFVDGEKVWERMIEMNAGPNGRSYDARLLGLALAKRVNDAVELIQEIRLQGVELSVYSFNFVIRGYVVDDNLEGVKRWYGEIGKSGFVPNKLTFDTMIPFLCEKDDLGFAFEVCKEAFDRKCYVDAEVLQPVVDGLVEQEKFEKAKELVELAKRNKYYCGQTLKLPAEV